MASGPSSLVKENPALAREKNVAAIVAKPPTVPPPVMITIAIRYGHNHLVDSLKWYNIFLTNLQRIGSRR